MIPDPAYLILNFNPDGGQTAHQYITVVT